MAETALESLEKRVAALEQGMARWLRMSAANGPWKDWRLAAGQFTPTDLSEELDAAGREVREADRRQVDA
jgi:hypothetical protein